MRGTPEQVPRSSPSAQRAWHWPCPFCLPKKQESHAAKWANCVCLLQLHVCCLNTQLLTHSLQWLLNTTPLFPKGTLGSPPGCSDPPSPRQFWVRLGLTCSSLAVHGWSRFLPMKPLPCCSSAVLASSQRGIHTVFDQSLRIQLWDFCGCHSISSCCWPYRMI